MKNKNLSFLLQGDKGRGGLIVPGPPGLPGRPGVDGLPGSIGDIGLQGSDGFRGSIGSKGIKGGTGPQGRRGIVRNRLTSLNRDVGGLYFNFYIDLR